MLLAIFILKISSPMSFLGLFLVLLAQADFELALPHLSLLDAGVTGVSCHTWPFHVILIFAFCVFFHA